MRGQPVQHVRVALGQRVPGGQDQAAGIAVLAVVQLGAAAQRREPAGLQACRGGVRPAVPVLSRGVVAEAGPGVDEDEAGHPLRMREREVERQVTAERVTAENGTGQAELVQDRGHVAERGRRAVAVRVSGVVAAAVAADVPGDDLVARAGSGEIRAEHRGGGAVAVREQQCGLSAAADLVADARRRAGSDRACEPAFRVSGR